MRRIISVLVVALCAAACELRVDSPCSSSDPGCAAASILGYALNARYVLVGDTGTILNSNDALLWSNATIGGANLFAAAFGHAGFVAVGQGGVIYQSPTGKAGSWTPRSSGTALNILGIAYGRGQYVAVGGNAGTGLALRSSDGAVWTMTTAPFAAQIYTALFYPANGGEFVAVGPGGRRAVSTDGFTWTLLSPIATSDNLIGGLAYGNGLLVSGSDLNVVLRGDSAASLVQSGSIPAGTTTAVAFFRDRFIFGSDTGALSYSLTASGAATAAASPTAQGREMALTSTDLVLTSGGQSVTAISYDGVNWSLPSAAPPTTTTIQGGAFGYVAAAFDTGP